MGSANLLEIIRLRPWIRTSVIVTSDKCYENVNGSLVIVKTTGLAAKTLTVHQRPLQKLYLVLWRVFLFKCR